MDNTYRQVWDIGAGDAEKLTIMVDGGEAVFYFFKGKSFDDIVGEYTSITGRSPMPPLWTLGFIQSKCSYKSWGEVEDLIDEFERRQIPLDGIVFDYDWAEGFNNYKCNTLSHLSAGIFDIQRTGDDTSGIEWERTRKMGINTLAFRMPQNGTFYMADADCAGITEKISWQNNKEWIALLAESGTPLFVSVNPQRITAEQKEYIKAAFGKALKVRKEAVPHNWMDTTCPDIWNTDVGIKKYKFPSE